MTPLPIDEHIPRILRQLRQSRALVLVAEPGAGKTTRLAPAIVKSDLLDQQHPNLVMLQPRRLAARAAALRIAAENHWQIGREVGWHVRFDRRLSSGTRLRVLTEGILTRQLIEDPFLQGIGAVILDEFHERSIHTDLTIALLREVRQTVRPDLMLIVMSATLDAGPVARFLEDCPIIQVPGSTHPIQIEYAAAPSGQPLPRRVAQAIEDVRCREEGNILVFLPGVQEINRTARTISSAADREQFRVFPLHGSLPPEEQYRALEPCPQRKIILATNIAETSLTIEGVRVVIDSGLARVAGYDPQRGLDRLELRRISKASARQRAGRAGRTASGLCIRLYTEKEFHAMPDFELPEVRRVDLAGTVLALHAWGKPDPRAFDWFEQPTEQTLASAERLLEMLGAIEDGRITRLGQQMISLPVHPRLARLLIAAVEYDMLQEGAAIAALLSEKDLAPADGLLTTQAASDLIVRLELIESNPQVARLRDELIRIGRTIKRPTKPRHHDRDEAMLRLALVGYPDRVCRRRASDPSAGVMVGGGGVRLAGESVVRQHDFFVALDARQDERSPAREALVRIASGIQPQWLEEYFPHEIRRERKLIFDAQRKCVVSLNTVSYRDLVIREQRDAPADPQEAGSILAEVLRPDAQAMLLRNDEAATFLARVDLLRRAMPEHDWPTFDAVQIVTEMCQGRRSVEEVEQISPLPFLQSRLPYPLKRLLDEHAPQMIQVPSGNRIRVQYAPGQPPVLAVRLQELFGWTDTPRIAAGRVPLVLHLLGPNFRPVQITSDLSSFWKTTYFEVRKDLRLRYPKHSWPDDPLSAQPQAKPGRRR